MMVSSSLPNVLTRCSARSIWDGRMTRSSTRARIPMPRAATRESMRKKRRPMVSVWCSRSKRCFGMGPSLRAVFWKPIFPDISSGGIWAVGLLPGEGTGRKTEEGARKTSQSSMVPQGRPKNPWRFLRELPIDKKRTPTPVSVLDFSRVPRGSYTLGASR